MVKFLQLFLVTVLAIIIEIYCLKPIGNILSGYYESDLVKTFKKEWEKFKKPYEHAVMTELGCTEGWQKFHVELHSLKENYGRMGMNVHVKHVRNYRKITRGFYLSDNVVNVLFYDMVLRELPNLIMPEVSLSLASNLLKVEATVSKMFVDTDYRMSRNESAVLYSEADLGKNKHSPFSLQQVQPSGKLTISAEDCFLSGFAIVTLLGNSVALGHSTFRLVDCKFTVEISSGFASPPVIAPYFPKGPGKQIERLLSAPLLAEVVQNLQGAMYSYINTSVAFGTELSKYKINQQKLFKKTSNYLSELCDKLNNLTLQERRGSIALSDFDERIESKTDEVRSKTYLTLKDLKLYGLETAYAARTGGSFEAPQLSIADEIRFHSLQIRGKAFYDNGTQSDTYDFAAELTDVSVNIIINVDKEGSKSVHKFEVLLARTFDFSVLPWETVATERVWYQALVSGYIINEVPARITEHLSTVLTPAVTTEDDGLKFDSENVEQVKKEMKIKVKDYSDDTYADERSESKEAPMSEYIDPDDLEPLEHSGTSADTNESAEQLNAKPKQPQDNNVGILERVSSAEGDNDNVNDNLTNEEPLNNPDTRDFRDSENVQIFNDTKQKLPSEKIEVGFDEGALETASSAENNNDNVDDKFAIEEPSSNPDTRDIRSSDDVQIFNDAKQKLPSEKIEVSLDKDFFSDDGEKKPFFSDDGGKKPFFSDDGGEKNNTELLFGDKMDAGLDKKIFSDDEGKKPFFSDNGGDKLLFSDDNAEKQYVDKNKEMANNKTENNGEGQHLLIFASSENEKDQFKDDIDNNGGPMATSDKDDKNNEMANSEPDDNGKEKQILIFGSSENEKDQLKDEIPEQSDEHSVRIGRTKNNDHRIRYDINNKSTEIVNRKKPIAKVPKNSRKGSNKLKFTLKKKPRAINITHVPLSKKATETANRIQRPQVHNNTRLRKNEMHMSDNEIR